MNLWPTQNVFKKELSTYYVCRFPLASINFQNIGIDFNLDILRCSKRHVCVGAKVIKNSNLELSRTALWGTHFEGPGYHILILLLKHLITIIILGQAWK